MITIKNLFKKYNNIKVLNGLNLEVKEKEILVILGRSGEGKSVLLKHIIGLEKPDEGTIEINKENILSLKEKDFFKIVKNMGMLFQGAALFDSLNVEENVEFYLSYNSDPISNKKLKKEEIKKKAKEALLMVSMENTEKKMPSDLSGGMKKRVGIARLIAYRPKILLYDEPTTGLDPITAQQINELIVKTQNELEGTSIVVTHDLHSALFIADRIALLEKGRISHITTPKEFLNIDNPIISFLKESLTHHPSGRKEQKNV